jgi:hypothetical protein
MALPFAIPLFAQRVRREELRFCRDHFWHNAKSPVHSPTATCRRGRLREHTGLLTVDLVSVLFEFGQLARLDVAHER